MFSLTCFVIVLYYERTLADLYSPVGLLRKQLNSTLKNKVKD